MAPAIPCARWRERGSEWISHMYFIETRPAVVPVSSDKKKLSGTIPLCVSLGRLGASFFPRHCFFFLSIFIFYCSSAKFYRLPARSSLSAVTRWIYGFFFFMGSRGTGGSYTAAAVIRRGGPERMGARTLLSQLFSMLCAIRFYFDF